MALVDLGLEGQVVWFKDCGQVSKRVSGFAGCFEQ